MDKISTSSASDRPCCFRCRRPIKIGRAFDKTICHVCLIADEAEDALGEFLVRHFPRARRGDLSPATTIAFRLALENAIAEWITNNVPKWGHRTAADARSPEGADDIPDGHSTDCQQG